MDDDLEITTPAQMKALAHPMRHRIWRELGTEGATISQLTHRLETNKGNVAHHLGVLVASGLARKGRSRTVRGGTEQYYLRTAARLRFGAGDDGEATAAMLGSVGAEIQRAKRPLLTHRAVRLTRVQAEALGRHLEKVVDELEPAGPREASYGVLVSVYRR